METNKKSASEELNKHKSKRKKLWLTIIVGIVILAGFSGLYLYDKSQKELQAKQEKKKN